MSDVSFTLLCIELTPNLSLIISVLMLSRSTYWSYYFGLKIAIFNSFFKLKIIVEVK